MVQSARESLVAGWYPDPGRRHELRYWNGAAWTDYVADGGVQSLDSSTSGSTYLPAAPPGATADSRNVRRALWLVYALPMTLLLPLSSVQAIRQSGAIAALDFVISLPSLVALHLHIWDKRTLSGALWKGYAFSYIAWQLAYGFVLAPAVTPQNVVAAVIGMVLLAPLLIALFAYAFRKWEPRSL